MTANLQIVIKRREFTVLGLIVVLMVIFSLSTEKFMSVSNLSNLLLQLSGVAISAIGMTMVIITGGIDVSVGSILGMASVVAGKLLMAGSSFVVVVLSAIITGFGIGILNGIIISYGNVPPIIVTLGMMSMMRALMYQVLGGRWVSGIPPDIRIIGLGKWLGIPLSMWITAVLIILFSYFLSSRPTGRAIYAIGNNPEAARVSGVNLARTILIVYSLTGLLVGFAGLIYVARTGIVQTNTGSGFELEVIAAVMLGGTSVFGGKGTVIGSLLGAVLVGIIKNGMVLMNVPALSEGLVIGILILISVMIDLVRSRGESL
ncbi:MAG TPA: ABC transporter permease [Atribacter sp.]|jgi:ribose transport system permease protein|uniref:Autoinducer 2 import system permease protein LsrC n=1 Tax=Candidatus Atribacter allofermentans TaxID=1852833 RepID=A0A1V5T348_9BACT|nr:ABC transporter permease [Atribacter sp.]MDD3714185.1 ABC transporter permease [Atribacterota bacterium]OQA61186.1 MAG: Ribose transport system permease protein RbsC [Candidatus Atribacteria bacterium ADurb.Bin276]HHT09483.1 ABC transporter permease [Candidatus Atribacteria bacterium]MDI9593683.1 ABC transporter permease [Atribacterota bacterium]HOT05564.1 ABC transporter permease [Atribacter sp.]